MITRFRARHDAARVVGAGGVALTLAGATLFTGALLPTATATPKEHDGNPTCEDLGFPAPPPADGWDDTGKVERPVGIENEYVSTTVHDFDENDEPYLVDVAAKPGFMISAVIVKGGTSAFVYIHEPFEDMEAPRNEGGQLSAVSHYTICGKKKTPPTTTPPMTTPPETTPPETTPPETTPPETTPPETTPPKTTPPTSEPALDVDVLAPICDGDVPYLQYEIDPVGFDATETRIVWTNPDGDDFAYEDLPLSGRVLWPGAVTDDEGNPLDWPGWTQLADGTWEEGDEWDWVRPSVEVILEVNPTQTFTIDYPPSSPQCLTNPPMDGLPKTGMSESWPVLAGAAMVVAGLAMVLTRGRVATRK